MRRWAPSIRLTYYGRAGRFEDLERWGGRLIRVAEAFAADREIRLQEAKGAYNALNNYRQCGMGSSDTAWQNRLAAIARDFPADLNIQQIAKDAGVSYADQMGFALRFPAPSPAPAGPADKPPT